MAQLFWGLFFSFVVHTTSLTLGALDGISILEMHNTLRSQEGAADMKSMSLLSSMTTIAQQWLDSCDLSATMPNPPSGKSSINMNIHKFDGAVNLTEAVYTWYKQKTYYNYDSHGCALSQRCLDYIQMVTADTEVMGCALKDCTATAINKKVLVCFYANGLDLLKQPYQKGGSCTKCSSGIFWCKNGLCRDVCPASLNCKCKAKCGKCGVETTDCKCSCLGDYTGNRCSVGTSCDSKTTNSDTAIETTTAADKQTVTTQAVDSTSIADTKETTTAGTIQATDTTNKAAVTETTAAGTTQAKAAETETTRAGTIQTTDNANKAATVETTTAGNIQANDNENKTDTTTAGSAQKQQEVTTNITDTTTGTQDRTQQTDTTTTSPDITTDINAQCADFPCKNGGEPYFRIRKRRLDKCWCKCTAEFQGRRCKKSRKEAGDGVVVTTTADITLAATKNNCSAGNQLNNNQQLAGGAKFDMLWGFLKLIIMFSVNNFCRNNVDVCCPGSTNPVSRIPNNIDYITANDIKIGAGYPDNDDVLLEIMFFVEARPDNALCTYATSNGKRKKRQAQASTSIILPQSILQNVVSSASNNISAALSDCCNATLSSVQPGQVDNTTEILTTAATTTVQPTSQGIGTFLLAVIVGVIAAILVLVIIFMIVIAKSYKNDTSYEDKNQQYYRYPEPQPRIARKPYIYGGYANYSYGGPSIYDVRGGIY